MIDKLFQLRNQITSLLIERADRVDGMNSGTPDVLNADEKRSVEELASKSGLASEPLSAWAGELRQNSQTQSDLFELMLDAAKAQRTRFQKSFDVLCAKMASVKTQSARVSNQSLLPEGLGISPLDYYEQVVAKEDATKRICRIRNIADIAFVLCRVNSRKSVPTRSTSRALF